MQLPPSKYFKSLTVSLLCLLNLSQLSAQNIYFSTKHAVSELATIKRVITDYHPSPFRYISETSWHNRYQEVLSAITQKDTISTFEFLSLAGPLVTLMRDEHSKLSPNKDLLKNNIETRRLFPFEVSRSSDNAFIIRKIIDSSIDQGFIGRKINAINGQQVSKIIETLQLCIGSSASSDYSGTLYHALNFDNFSRLYFLCCDQSEKFDIQFSSGEKKQFPGYRPSKRAGTLYKFNAENSPEFYISNDASLAYLKVSSFWPDAFNSSLKRTKEAVDGYFQQLKDRQVSKIVIDVRGNRGGTPFISTYLAGYFFQQPYRPFLQVTAKRKAAEDFPKQFKGPRKPEFTTGSEIVTLPKRLQGFETNHAKNLIFNGEVVVLIDAGSGSASTIFASLMSKVQNIQFLGQETLGDGANTTGGQYSTFDLPYSKLTLRIPLLMFHHGPNEAFYGVKADSAEIDSTLLLNKTKALQSHK